MKVATRLNEYDKQALDFLESTGTTLEVQYLYTGPYFDNDEAIRDVYSFVLKNAKGMYSGKFGDSVRNTERRHFAKQQGIATHGFSPSRARSLGFNVSNAGYIKRHELQQAATHTPSAYDILSCLTTYDPGSFDDFCSDFGYNDEPLSEYPRIMKTYNAVLAEYRGLSAMYSEEELSQMSEIA